MVIGTLTSLAGQVIPTDLRSPTSRFRCRRIAHPVVADCWLAFRLDPVALARPCFGVVAQRDRTAHRIPRSVAAVAHPGPSGFSDRVGPSKRPDSSYRYNHQPRRTSYPHESTWSFGVTDSVVVGRRWHRTRYSPKSNQYSRTPRLKSSELYRLKLSPRTFLLTLGLLSHLFSRYLDPVGLPTASIPLVNDLGLPAVSNVVNDISAIAASLASALAAPTGTASAQCPSGNCVSLGGVVDGLGLGGINTILSCILDSQPTALPTPTETGLGDILSQITQPLPTVTIRVCDALR
ncbi:hypothetical protein C8F01DRAFT_1088819 [Mycena amicta]|nr:hypothetical protein C8F01DRAFT_1088819 [Mycena amicta]